MDPRILRLTVRDVVISLADLAAPRVCTVCGRELLPRESHICVCCLSDMPFTRFSSLFRNPMADKFNGRIIATGLPTPYYEYATALFYYRPLAGYRHIPQAIKYRRDFSAGRYFARMLGTSLAASTFFADVDLVVPVPLHWTRRRSRGYNQADCIACELAEVLGVKVDTRLLKRCRRTRTQTRLDSVGKAKNVEGAFAVRESRLGQLSPSASACGTEHILLVDDVFTTGATLAACWAALRQCYSGRISVATLAYVGQ